ncbi:MAG: hypothetical protein ACYTXE_43890 [Nostoc sp.]
MECNALCREEVAKCYLRLGATKPATVINANSDAVTVRDRTLSNFHELLPTSTN